MKKTGAIFAIQSAYRTSQKGRAMRLRSILFPAAAVAVACGSAVALSRTFASWSLKTATEIEHRELEQRGELGALQARFDGARADAISVTESDIANDALRSPFVAYLAAMQTFEQMNAWHDYDVPDVRRVLVMQLDKDLAALRAALESIPSRLVAH